jgi:hypothetical protein
MHPSFQQSRALTPAARDRGGEAFKQAMKNWQIVTK